jgi:hypothetical protein
MQGLGIALAGQGAVNPVRQPSAKNPTCVKLEHFDFARRNSRWRTTGYNTGSVFLGGMIVLWNLQGQDRYNGYDSEEGGTQGGVMGWDRW